MRLYSYDQQHMHHHLQIPKVADVYSNHAKVLEQTSNAVIE